MEFDHKSGQTFQTPVRERKIYQQSYYARHREARSADSRARYLRYKSERPNFCTIVSLRKRYGLTVDDVAVMRAKQNNCCGLCSKPFDDEVYGLKPVVDHNHATKQNRALLHQRCNVRLGVIEDEVFYEQALRYLEEHNARTKQNTRESACVTCVEQRDGLSHELKTGL